jgi:hypothetical protein
MITTHTTKVLPRWISFLVGSLILLLISSCNNSSQEIPEPDYNPFILRPGNYVESTGAEVSMDTIIPPEVITIKVQNLETQKVPAQELQIQYLTGKEDYDKYLESGSDQKYFQKEPRNHYVIGPTPTYSKAEPVEVDISSLPKPEYIQDVGIKTQIEFPAGLNRRLRLESTGNYYIGLLDQKLGLNSDMVYCLMEE